MLPGSPGPDGASTGVSTWLAVCLALPQEALGFHLANIRGVGGGTCPAVSWEAWERPSQGALCGLALHLRLQSPQCVISGPSVLTFSPATSFLNALTFSF